MDRKVAARITSKLKENRMQKLLRVVVFLLLAVSLLWTPPTFAAQYHHASHVKLVYCDFHVCLEKPHYIGKASFYGKHYWQGRKMANGNRFDYRKPSIATWGIPLGTTVRVTNLRNGKSIVVEVTDQGPAHSLHRVADLSQAAAEALDYVKDGMTMVMIQVVVLVDTEVAVLDTTLVESPELVSLEPPIVVAGKD
jgi:rare lipoprotein A (peptidoglycan hydrolase)